MSQPKRFDFWMYQKPCEHFGIRATMQMEFSEDGRFVSWDDYSALAAENERLRSASFVTAVPSEQYEKLQTELERLVNLVAYLKEGKPLTKHEDDIRSGLRTK